MLEWRDQTWGFAKQIMPLLFMGVLAAGFFLGSPSSADAGIIPNSWIQALVGDSPLPLLSLLGSNTESAPGWLAVDGQVKRAGTVLSADDIKTFLT